MKYFLVFLHKKRHMLFVRVKNRLTYCLLSILVILLTGCDFKLKPFDEEESDTLSVIIQRYDRLESLYLTTGDFSALQQMSTDYPIETRTLIENVLELGDVDEPEINNKLLRFFQDSTLQTIISDAEAQYANVADLNHQLSAAFHKLKQRLPNVRIPLIYAQICALNQSIVVGDESLGICLDKYLGEDYPLYTKYYPQDQRKSMNRSNIVPDVLSCYLLSLYNLPNYKEKEQEELDLHLGKIHWIVNKLVGYKAFSSSYVNIIDKYMTQHPHVSIEKLLSDNDYTKFRPVH